ncbi:MAG: adenosine deaminase [Desulfobacteraceae bacterium]|nr:adenosine deaminase [Desulfobacteraceae bacterium]
MKIKSFICIIVIMLLTGCSTFDTRSKSSTNNELKTSLFYNKLIQGSSPNTAQLNLFFAQMPKGGDLHNHYSGSIYVETYLDWVKTAGYWINKDTLHIDETKTKASISVDQLRSDTKLYRKLLTLWSNKDFQNHYRPQLPPDASFFNTFSYFQTIAKNHRKGLIILRNRAIRENVSYLEIILDPVDYSYPDKSLDEKLEKTDNKKSVSRLLDKLSSKIDADHRFNKKVDKFTKDLEAVHKGIDDDKFMMRYQTCAFRDDAPSLVFSSLYAGFKAAEKSDLLMGVNIVGPENGVTAIRDYTLHMQMFNYLRQKFPDVNRALHAGELTIGMVRPKNLNFHITQAVRIAGAQRIGHGVDIPYEKDAIDLLKEIKEKSVVEICFTSNEFILGVKGQNHPYLLYSAYDVPLVICTDDSGVSRDNLTHEYVLLATRYKPSYKTIKKYVYNSIKYAFCSKSDKTLLINALDARFKKFETQMAAYSDLISK